MERNRDTYYQILDIMGSLYQYILWMKNMQKSGIFGNIFVTGFPTSAQTLQGIRTQIVKSNSAVRDRRMDISEILWYSFSRKLKYILISKLTFIYKKPNVSEPNYFLQSAFGHPVGVAKMNFLCSKLVVFFKF